MTAAEPEPAAPPREVRRGGRVAIAVLAAAAVVAVFVGWRTFHFLTDDAYIAFRYIANARDGYGLVWNPPPFLPVEGYTSFLWVILLKTVWQLTGVEPPAAANALSLAFGYATLAIGWLLTRRMQLPPAVARARDALAVLVFAGTVTNRTFLAWLSSGLETSLFNFLLTWWLFEALTRPPRRSSLWPVRLATAGALAALARPDGLLAAAGSAWLLFRDARRRSGRGAAIHPVLAGAAPLAFVPLHLLWRRALYGEWLPNTYYAKVEGAWPASGLRYAACFVLENGTWVWCLLASALLIKTVLDRGRGEGERRRLGSHHLVPCGVLAISFAYYTLVVGGDHFEYRVLSHLVLLSLLSAAWLAARVFPRPAAAVAAVALFVLASLPIPWVHWWETRNLITRESTHVLVKPIAASFPPPLRAVVERWDRWQAWLIRHHVGMRHQEHQVFHRFMIAQLPSREMGSRLPWLPDRPVIAESTVGVLGWTLPHVAVIDRFGLNDRVIARSPPARPAESRLMAHDRLAPPGYVECFRPNVRIVGIRQLTIRPRAQPLTDDDIRACESRAW